MFADALVESLALADRVVLAAVFQSSVIAEAERLVPEMIVRELRERGVAAEVREDAVAIVAAMATELEYGDVVAIMSNGGFGDIYHLLPAVLHQQVRVETAV